jgi:hypothetical protein
MATFTIKKNDNLPVLSAVLKDGDGVEIDMTGATVVFRMRRADGTQHIYKVNAAASFVTDGSDGAVEYEWQAGDLDTPGDYLGEFVITFGGGDVQTVPNDDYIRVKVVDLA